MTNCQLTWLLESEARMSPLGHTTTAVGALRVTVRGFVSLLAPLVPGVPNTRTTCGKPSYMQGHVSTHAALPPGNYCEHGFNCQQTMEPATQDLIEGPKTHHLCIGLPGPDRMAALLGPIQRPSHKCHQCRPIKLRRWAEAVGTACCPCACHYCDVGVGGI